MIAVSHFTIQYSYILLFVSFSLLANYGTGIGSFCTLILAQKVDVSYRGRKRVGVQNSEPPHHLPPATLYHPGVENPATQPHRGTEVLQSEGGGVLVLSTPYF